MFYIDKQYFLCYIVNDQKEYEEALTDACQYGADIVVEEYIKGREFSVAVVDDKAYPIIEIAPIQGFYDYKNKYQAGSTVETCPAEISPELTAKMQENAVKAAKALGLTGYSRLDFMMKENGDMYCLEAKYPSGNDSYQSDSSGGEGTGNGLSDALRGTDPDFFKEVRIIYRMFILNIKRIK